MLKKYDGLLIFAGSLKDEALDKVIDKAGGEIERLGGLVETKDVLGRRTFARQLQKRDNGVYVKIRFQLPSDQLAALRARYRLSDEVFRMQVLARDERFDAAKEADQIRRAAHRATAEAAAAAAAASAPAMPQD